MSEVLRVRHERVESLETQISYHPASLSVPPGLTFVVGLWSSGTPAPSASWSWRERDGTLLEGRVERRRDLGSDSSR